MFMKLILYLDSAIEAFFEALLSDTSCTFLVHAVGTLILLNISEGSPCNGWALSLLLLTWAFVSAHP